MKRKRTFKKKRGTFKRKRTFGKRRTFKKRKRTFKGTGTTCLPKVPSNSVQGSYCKPAIQSKAAKRKAHLQIVQKYAVSNSFALIVGVANCLTMWFVNNSISDASFTGLTSDNAGSNLPATFATASSSRRPAGIQTELWAQFQKAQVVGSELIISFSKEAGITADDVPVWVAMTPLTYQDSRSGLVGGAALVAGVAPQYIGNYFGASALAADQWQVIIQQAGTVYRRLNYSATDTSNRVTLRLKHNQSWFNTQPLWQSSSGSHLTKTGPAQMQGPIFQNMYAVSLYFPTVNAASFMPLFCSITQKWYINAWDNIPASIEP